MNSESIPDNQNTVVGVVLPCLFNVAFYVVWIGGLDVRIFLGILKIGTALT